MKKARRQSQVAPPPSLQPSQPPITPNSNPRYFKKIIFYTFQHTSDINYHNKMLLRYRKLGLCPTSLSLRSPQDFKSLKTVRTIRIEDNTIKKVRHAQSYYNQLKKIDKVHKYELHLQIHESFKTFRLHLDLYNSINTNYPLKKYWEPILEALKRSNPNKCEIHTHYQFLDDRYYDYGLSQTPWWQAIFPIVARMINLQLLSLHTYSQNPNSLRKNEIRDLDIAQKYYNPLQRLSKLQEVRLIRLEDAINSPLPFYKALLSSSKMLEKVNIALVKEDYRLFLLEPLCNIDRLKQVNFQGHIEIEELLSLIRRCPLLSSIGFFRLWSHAIKPETKSLLKDCTNLQNITSLCLDAGTVANTADHQAVYLGLLKALVNLESLKIDLKWKKIAKFQDEYALILSSFTKLLKLEIAVSFTTFDNMTKFFKKMKTLTTLRHFVIVIEIPFPEEYEKDKVQKPMNAFAEFLQGQKNLETVEMYWYKLNITSLQRLCPVLLKLQDLKSLKIAFGTTSRTFNKDHVSMLNEVRKTISEIKITGEVHFQIIGDATSYFNTSSLEDACKKSIAKLASFTCSLIWTCYPFSIRWEM